MGYPGEWRRYAIQHELTHHALADYLCWDYSWSLYQNPPQPWPNHVGWEEHIVNRAQRHMRLGEPDEFGVLDAVFGGNLEIFETHVQSFWSRVPEELYR